MTSTLFSQADRTRYTLAYSLHLSDAAGSGPGRYFDPALAQSVFVTAELSTKRSSRFTIGAGFLQSRMKHSDLHHNTYENIEQHINVDFVSIPAGIKFRFGSFYIHPELAVTYNYRLTINSYFLDSEMNPLHESYDQFKSDRSFEVLFASLMSLGHEIKVGTITVMTGVKGYFAFNNNYVNTFGVGLMAGVKI